VHLNGCPEILRADFILMFRSFQNEVEAAFAMVINMIGFHHHMMKKERSK
jgi:hypothetical protein